jgi:hypothetical protein
MKTDLSFIILLACAFSLAACRPEREDTGKSSNQQAVVPETIPDPPLPQVEHPDTRPFSTPRQNPTAKDDPDTWSGLTGDELVARKMEWERAELFAVPLSDEVARVREEAWEKLTTMNHRFLPKEKYQYAQELLNRYRDAPLLESLVIWRLLDLRLHNQGVSSLARVADDDYRQLRLSMRPQLNAMMYSALDEDPEKLPHALALRRAMETLQKAAGTLESPGH